MKNDVFTVILLIALNAVIIGYEKGFDKLTWKHYFAFGILCVIALMLPMAVMFLLIPITGYNILINTKKFQGRFTK